VEMMGGSGCVEYAAAGKN